MRFRLNRYLLLQKRMVRKKSYILMVLSLFAFVFTLRGISMQDSDMATVAICVEEKADAAATALADGFQSSDVIHYQSFAAKEDAIAAVESGEIDEAWIIPANLSELVTEFAINREVTCPVQIYVREENVLHFFLREILQGHIYRLASKKVLTDYADKEIDMEKYVPAESIFELYTVGQDEEAQSLNYVVMPLRGFVALWLFISTIAAAMYYIYDRKNGLFIYWQTRTPFLREFLYFFIIIFDSALIALLGLYCGGVFTTLGRELLSMLLYVVILTFFGIFLERLLTNAITIGVITPVLLVVAAIFSPVFVDLRSYKLIQNCIPSFHYLKSVFDGYYFGGMAIYGIVLAALALGVYAVRERMRIMNKEKYC